MRAEIVSTGTELLLGKNCNEDARILCELLAKCGIDIYRYTTVGDNVERISQSYKEAIERADIVLSTGGLGGTGSDLSKQAASIATGIPLEIDQRIYEYLLRQRVPERIARSFASIPRGSSTIENTAGVAPGIIIQKNGKYLILLPGPPDEIRSIIRNGLEDFLRKFGNGYTKNDFIKIVGMRESEVEDRIHDLAKSSNPTISTFLKKGWIEISMTAKGKDEDESIRILDDLKKRVLERFPKEVIGSDESLEHVVYRILNDKNMTIAVAESVTGGMISDKLVNVSGVSSVFLGGVVAYSNESKIKVLGVSEKTIKENGAISAGCVSEMADGVRLLFGTDIGIATTGIAGPSSVENKEIGMVWFGFSSKTLKRNWKRIYGGNRDDVRRAATNDALEAVINIIARNERS